MTKKNQVTKTVLVRGKKRREKEKKSRLVVLSLPSADLLWSQYASPHVSLLCCVTRDASSAGNRRLVALVSTLGGFSAVTRGGQLGCWWAVGAVQRYRPVEATQPRYVGCSDACLELEFDT